MYVGKCVSLVPDSIFQCRIPVPNSFLEPTRGAAIQQLYNLQGVVRSTVGTVAGSMEENHSMFFPP